MPRDGSGIYSKASASFVSNTTITSSSVNADFDDLVNDANNARPVTAGGTGAATAAGALTNLGIDTDATLAANSDTKFPSQKATKAYVTSKRGRRNRFVNPAYQISQEKGNTAVTTSGAFAADQWQLFFTASTAAMSLQRVQTSLSLHGSPNKLEFRCTTAKTVLGASDYVAITQNIEGNELADLNWGTASAKQLVDSFTFKAPAGTYHAHYSNSATNRHYAAPFTISAGLANTETQITLVVPGDTTGTWLTDTGLGLTRDIVLAAGTSLQGTASAWTGSTVYAASTQFNILGLNTNVVQIADNQLSADPDLTGVAPGWELPEYGQVLRESQRFYEKSFTQGTAPASALGVNAFGPEIFTGIVAGASQNIWQVRYQTTKLSASPTVTIYNPVNSNSQVYNTSRSADCASTSIAGNVNDRQFVVAAIGPSGSLTGDQWRFHWTSSARY